MHNITISINGNAISYMAGSHPIVIRELDSLKIRILANNDGIVPEVFFEDYKAELEQVVIDEITYFETPESRYFSESFGYSVVRVDLDGDATILAFDIQAKKTSVDQAKKMIGYLAQHSERLINSCFSRSSLGVGSSRSDSVNSETMLTCAEDFVDRLQAQQSELLNNVRERLLPVRVPVWQTSLVNAEIDPYDVVNNLDALTPTSGNGDVFLKGRNFELSGIYVSTVMASANVIENQILLGGLYSIYRQVSILQKKLELFDSSTGTLYEGYESFSRLLLSLTCEGMKKRSAKLISSLERFIKLFEENLDVKYKGEIAPRITPYVRSTRVYRTLFTSLGNWYQLGEPNLAGEEFLMKLKSLSKIYEIFVLFHLIDELISQGFEIHDATPHKDMGDVIPSEVFFVKGEDELLIQYEPIINIWTPSTAHMDLIDIGHNASSPFPYWNPDFVLRFRIKGQISYIILDAKYSTRSNVKEFHIPKIFDKYYIATSAYDAYRRIAVKAPILGVMAVFSLDDQTATHISKWSRHGISREVPSIPMVGGIGLMVDNSLLFSKFLKQIVQNVRMLSSSEAVGYNGF
jgi:hypothetical protein